MGVATATTKVTMSAIQESLVQLNLMLSGMAARQEKMLVDLRRMTAALVPTASITSLVMPGQAPLQSVTKPSSHSIALDDRGTAAAALRVSPALSSATPTRCSTVGLDSHADSNHAVVALPCLFTILSEAPAPTELLLVHPMQPSVAIKFSTPAPAMCSTECCHTNVEVQPSAFAQEVTPSESSAVAKLHGVLSISTDKVHINEVLTDVGGLSMFTEPCVGVVVEVEKMPPKDVVWDDENVDHVLSSIGGENVDKAEGAANLIWVQWNTVFGVSPPCRRIAFNPRKSGIGGTHGVFDKVPLGKNNAFHPGIFATKSDPLVLNKIPSWQRSAFSPWLGNTVQGIPIQQEGISHSTSPTESRWFFAHKRPWDPGDVANECDLFIQSFALIC